MSTWKSDLVWGSMAAAVIGYEVYTIKTGRLDYTLTRTTRRAMRTNHPVGKAAFAVGWGWFATWFMRHILETGAPDAIPSDQPAGLRLLEGQEGCG